jgi:hypothetical protein
MNMAGAKRPQTRTVAGLRSAHQSLNLHAARCGTFLCGANSQMVLRHDGLLQSWAVNRKVLAENSVYSMR